VNSPAREKVEGSRQEKKEAGRVSPVFPYDREKRGEKKGSQLEGEERGGFNWSLRPYLLTKREERGRWK